MLSLASSFTDGVGVCEKLFYANIRKHVRSHAGFKGLQSQGNFVVEPPSLCPLLLLLNSTGSCSHLFHHYCKLVNSSPWRRTQRRTHATEVKPWDAGSGDTWALWSLSIMHRSLSPVLCRPTSTPPPPQCWQGSIHGRERGHLTALTKTVTGFPQVSSPFFGNSISWQGSCMSSISLPGDVPSPLPEGAVQSLNAKQLLIFKVSVIYCQNKGWTLTLFEDNKLPLHSKIPLGYHWGIWKTYCCTENTVLHSSSLFCII